MAKCASIDLIGGRNYRVIEFEFERSGLVVVKQIYKTTEGLVAIEGGVVTHPNGDRTPERYGNDTAEWTEPTTYLKRFGDAIQALCGGNRPPDRMMLEYLDKHSDSFELQEFCIEHTLLGWAQGIVVIDAALTLADEPVEGVEHEGRP